ncbi:hypothetical protein LOK49_LG12G02248 [Camellia lanceoleosa]|uniref:Uncharacterized protein n=1 Tax=Camellia lanceoleosa TaxID=1840588 RepID=A0ACC0FVU6_9ERIC|nr:hypothetical protein LOK49_LG12G02248 [Camellia lanceoleosa]
MVSSDYFNDYYVPADSTSEVVTVVVDKNVITMEFQRQKAKELQKYFKQKKLNEADQGPLFGFIAKNEISNGSLDDALFPLFGY